MKLQSIEFEPKACLLFSRRNLEELAASASRHYDGECRRANERGGLLYGLFNLLGNGSYCVSLPLAFREVDLLAKISEAVFGGERLHAQLRQVLKVLNEVREKKGTAKRDPHSAREAGKSGRTRQGVAEAGRCGDAASHRTH